MNAKLYCLKKKKKKKKMFFVCCICLKSAEVMFINAHLRRNSLTPVSFGDEKINR